jgi:hypothetical protein
MLLHRQATARLTRKVPVHHSTTSAWKRLTSVHKNLASLKIFAKKQRLVTVACVLSRKAGWTPAKNPPAPGGQHLRW